MEPMDYEMDNDLDSPREPHTGLPRGTQCPYLRETVYGGNPPTRTPAWPQASPYSQPPSTAQTSPYYPPYPAFPAYDPSFDYASQYGHHHPPGSYGAQRAIFTRHRPHPAGQNQPNTRPGAIAHPPAPQPTTYGSLAPTLAPMSPQQQAYEAMRQQQQHQQQQQHHHHPHHPQQQQHQRNIPFNQQPTSPPYYLTPAYHGGSPYPQQPQQHQTEPPRTIAAWTSGGQTSFAGTRQSRQAPDFSSIYYNEFGYVHPIARQSAYMASPSNTAASDAHAPRPGPITTTATSEGIPNPTLTPAEPPAVTQTQEGPASRPRTLGYTGPPSRPTQAEDTMQIDSDDSDNSESHILANMSTLPFGFRPSAAQDYLASGYFEQNIVNSRENEGIADPGRPLRDFNAFLNGEGGRLSPTESFDESLGGRTPRRRRNATTTLPQLKSLLLETMQNHNFNVVLESWKAIGKGKWCTTQDACNRTC
ncbi:MAG: hypothetical protein M1833_000283 [Piccolia ochrophora]|nr:MAG: hypothetical protein M1833_000283 [Piccolia ochrophora]